MAIRENTYVYVKVNEAGEYKRSRCIKIHEDGTCDVKIMMKGNSYQKDENGNPIISKVNIDCVEETKPGKGTDKKENNKKIKENSEGKKIIFDETLLAKELDNTTHKVENFWEADPHDDFLTEEDVEKIGHKVFRMNKTQILKERLNY